MVPDIAQDVHGLLRTGRLLRWKAANIAPPGISHSLVNGHKRAALPYNAWQRGDYRGRGIIGRIEVMGNA
jgi:hypothetical protein